MANSLFESIRAHAVIIVAIGRLDTKDDDAKGNEKKAFRKNFKSVLDFAFPNRKLKSRSGLKISKNKRIMDDLGI